MVIIPLLMAGCAGPFSTLDPAGPSASAVAGLWWGMFAAATAVLLAVVGLWLYAAGRTQRELNRKELNRKELNSELPNSERLDGERLSREKFSDEQAVRIHRRWIIGGGLILPVTAIVLLLTFGIPVGHNMLPLPVKEEVLRIDVTGHQWWWQVNYPDGGVELRDELHIPAGVAVDLYLTSADVVHSFWVPRLGGKLDMLPGRTNILRLRADEPGTYRGQCAEFCGLHHAHMQFTVTAHSAADFAAWLAEARTDD